MTGKDIWLRVGTVVCDLDGVVYIGETQIADAGTALATVAAAGLQLLFVTNNSTKTPAEAAAKIERTTGFPATPDAVITSALVTADRLAGEVATAYVVGADSINQALATSGIESVDDWQRAECVVVGLDRDVSYERLSHATLAIRNGATFHATNTDSTFPTGEGLLPGGGAIVAAIQTAAEVEPIVSGKPHSPMIGHIERKAKGEILVVGDRVDTDIAMATNAGWRSALVLTGVSGIADVVTANAPDVVMESLPALASLLG